MAQRSRRSLCSSANLLHQRLHVRQPAHVGGHAQRGARPRHQLRALVRHLRRARGKGAPVAALVVACAAAGSGPGRAQGRSSAAQQRCAEPPRRACAQHPLNSAPAQRPTSLSLSGWRAVTTTL
jgi:hypothetical protein